MTPPVVDQLELPPRWQIPRFIATLLAEAGIVLRNKLHRAQFLLLSRMASRLKTKAFPNPIRE
jgi:hypothetical protein